jgi:uncharacterized membrane protein
MNFRRVNNVRIYVADMLISGVWSVIIENILLRLMAAVVLAATLIFLFTETIYLSPEKKYLFEKYYHSCAVIYDFTGCLD